MDFWVIQKSKVIPTVQAPIQRQAERGKNFTDPKRMLCLMPGLDPFVNSIGTVIVRRRSSSSGDSTTRMSSSSGGVKPPLQKRNSGSWLSRAACTPKYLWIRLALFERVLAGIIEHLVDNHEWVRLCRTCVGWQSTNILNTTIIFIYKYILFHL